MEAGLSSHAVRCNARNEASVTRDEKVLQRRATAMFLLKTSRQEATELFAENFVEITRPYHPYFRTASMALRGFLRLK